MLAERIANKFIGKEALRERRKSRLSRSGSSGSRWLRRSGSGATGLESTKYMIAKILTKGRIYLLHGRLTNRFFDVFFFMFKLIKLI